MGFDPLQIPQVFQARSLHSARRSIATGFDELDSALLGGWPTPSLIEILIDDYGIGELQLLIPLIRKLAQDGPQPPLIAWLNCPYVPNGVAFAQQRVTARHWIVAGLAEKDLLWAAEQTLRSNACSLMLAWTTVSSVAALRRLKLAAVSSESVGILYRPIGAAKQASPASLRIVLRPNADQLSIEIIKNEGRIPKQLSLAVRSREIGA